MNVTVGNILNEATAFSVNHTTLCILFLTFIVNFIFFNSLGGAFKRKRYPNGPWGFPIVGHLPLFGQSPPKTFEKWRNQYGNVYRIRLGSWKTVIINGYKAVKEAADKHDDFSGRPSFVTQSVLMRIYGEQPFAFGQFNHTYLEQRKLVASALRKYTSQSGNVTEDMIIEEGNILVDTLLQKDYSEPRDIRPDIQFAVCSVIYQLLYGTGKRLEKQTELKSIVSSGNKFIKFAGNGNPFDVMPWLRFVMPWKIEQFVNIIKENDGIRQQQVKEHYETFSKDNIRDITDSFIAADLDKNDDASKTQRLSRERLLGTLADLQGAGFDTTNKTIQWLVLYMASYPDVQKRVQEEIDDVIGSGNVVQLKDRTKLVYTDATIYEVMRITALAPFALPKYTTNNTKVDGYDIDKDTVVFFNLHSVLHEKEFWEDPKNFRPSRFLTDDNKLDTAKCSRVIPFGLGRRRCVGEVLAKMEIFILFVTIMRRCSVIKPETVYLDLEPVPGLVYSPGEFKIVVKER